ncbi:MAG: hypothetical protein WA642_21445 [Steroidobacteraceae bacterium]
MRGGPSAIIKIYGEFVDAGVLRDILTLIATLTIFVNAEGVTRIFVALAVRPYLTNWVWMLASGLINLVLAGLVWKGWPDTAKWVNYR